ncbi:MFS transporter [Cytobacillus sp. Hz8]|uniref:MFS transporter n=1 Tax=Cytobacillus sp. Hz8 TaxID=3347168 RepID=UPI0035DAA1DE
MDKQNSKYRWVVFGTVLLSYFFIVTQRTAPGLISDQIMKEFHVTAATIGLLTSIQFFAYAGLQIPIGILSDRFGPNFFLIVGTFLNGVGTIIYSLAQNEAILLVARLLVGMGDATIWVNIVLILSGWFKSKEFVGLLGIAGMSGSFGFLTATVPFSAWIALSGWRTPFLIVGLILCLCGLLLYYVLVKKSRELFSSYSEKKVSSERIQDKDENLLKRLFSNRQAWATFFCHFGLVGTYVGFIGSWAVPYGMHVYGMTRSAASQLIMVGLIGAIIGAPLTSWISGRFSSLKKPYIVVHMIVFLSWLGFLLFNGKPPVYLLIPFFFFIGYGNGASALTFAVVRESFALKEVGVISGFANTGGFLSAVLLPSLFGKILDHYHLQASVIGYHYGFMIPVLFALLGLMGGVLIKEKSQRDKRTKEISS